jgi:RAMP superfamily
MRDPKEYEAERRSDPLAPEQREQHPYDFVSLPGPGRYAAGHAVGHDRYLADRLTGTLVLEYRTETPLHVGSGVFETAEECGLAGGDTPVRGIVRSLGRPVLPGSSWKGAVRARFEAVTRSRLGVRSRGGREELVKLPGPLRPAEATRWVQVWLPRLEEAGTVRRGRGGDAGLQRQLERLSPAEALFGAMGYRGRVRAGEGEIAGAAAREPLSVPPLESPAAHRLAKPGAARVVGDHVEISAVEGRKFYYDGPLRDHRRLGTGEEDKALHELIDYVPAGCSIRLEVFVDSVTETEIGALLVSAGRGEDGGVLRFGGFKAAGLGSVSLQNVEARLRRGSAGTSWQRGEAAAFDVDGAVAAARSSGLIDAAALAELQEITTRRRP